MIICNHKNNTLQIMALNKQQSPNLRMPVESYKKTYLAELNCTVVCMFVSYLPLKCSRYNNIYFIY